MGEGTRRRCERRHRRTHRKGTHEKNCEETLLEKQNGEDMERDVVGHTAADALMGGGGTALKGLGLWAAHARTGTPLKDCDPWVSHTGVTSEEEGTKREGNREWHALTLTSCTAYHLVKEIGKD